VSPTLPTLDELIKKFQIAGARDPEVWAQSEVDENIPQLARYLFLRQAWRAIIAPNDEDWISREIKDSDERAGSPGTGLGFALKRLIDKGADPADLTEVARTIQWHLLFRLCYLLDDPHIEEPELQHIAWSLVEVAADKPTGRIVGGLHESVLDMDPTGHEMRPITEV
jgi:hypothetical protein